MSSKRGVWQERMEAWRASGISAAAFCRSHGLGYSQFVYWQRVLRGVSVSRDETRSWTPVVIETDGASASSGSPALIEVTLPNGVCVRVPSAGVTDAIALVRGLCAC